MTEATLERPKERRKLSINQNIRRESFGSMGVSELVSGVASMGVIAVLDDIAPHAVKSTTKFIAKHFVEPYLDVVENTLGYVCRLAECKPDKNKSRQERAESLSRAIVLFVPAFVVSWVAKIWTRKKVSKWLGVNDDSAPYASPRKWYELHKLLSKKDWLLVGTDESVHIGSIFVLNTAMPETSDKLIQTTEKVFEAIGFSKQKSKDLASMLVVWELPNALGWLSGVGGVYAHHKWGWAKDPAAHQEALAHDRVLQSTMVSAPGH